MDLRIFVEPQQGASYDDQLSLARHAEALGYDAFFRSDHYLKMGEGSGLPGPTDSWITLAGLARETERIRLGTMVSAATFRLPGVLAISVAQVDAMSGGRVELGLGTGWYESEHRAYGIPFPPQSERFARLEEQLAIITGLWEAADGSSFSFEGDHYALVDSPALPKPHQRPRPPVIVGGSGPVRTPRLAARFADEYNASFLSLERFSAQCRRVREACEAADRDPASMVLSVALVLCCGSGEDQVAARAAAIGRSPEELRKNGLAGTPAEVVDKIGRYAEAGATRVYLQTLDLHDHDHLSLVAAEVMPLL
ncbi:MAG: LLM class F420-dependent oxidoreductase [Acidobacteria bacterium]|nr:LLM class F420-dependent oxidoreductase [Acidobacteriota bacterium]